jgi:hypothetical protein
MSSLKYLFITEYLILAKKVLKAQKIIPNIEFLTLQSNGKVYPRRPPLKKKKKCILPYSSGTQ